jgi:proline iminopeptidase
MSVDACFLFPVGDGHRLWVETRGNPAGEPVLVLHGGPGSGCSPRFSELYDRARQFLVLPDQRGAGRSEPAGERGANTTAYLIADLEALRLPPGHRPLAGDRRLLGRDPGHCLCGGPS